MRKNVHVDQKKMFMYIDFFSHVSKLYVHVFQEVFIYLLKYSCTMKYIFMYSNNNLELYNNLLYENERFINLEKMSMCLKKCSRV